MIRAAAYGVLVGLASVPVSIVWSIVTPFPSLPVKGLDKDGTSR